MAAVVNSEAEAARLSLPNNEGIRALTEVGMYLARVLHLSSHLFAAVTVLPFVESSASRSYRQVKAVNRIDTSRYGQNSRR
jgi:hypothetical protein